MNTATPIKDIYTRPGHTVLYALDPPLTDKNGTAITHVVVSAFDVKFGTGERTFIYPADPDGRSVNLFIKSEQDGSYYGGLSHEYALRGLGYVIRKADG